MTNTVINLDVFEPSHRLGLLFSMYEGLLAGESFIITMKEGLDEIKNQLASVQVENLRFKSIQSLGNSLQIEIRKISEGDIEYYGSSGR